jgi:hypothetical protein
MIRNKKLFVKDNKNRFNALTAQQSQTSFGKFVLPGDQKSARGGAKR